MEGLAWLGKLLVFGGLTMAAIGVLLWLAGRLPWLEHLPGTLRIERPGFTCVIPILASIILSVVLTVILNVIARFLNR